MCQSFHIVPDQHLLVHVEEEFSSPVQAGVREQYVPVEMVRICLRVLSEVPKVVLWI